MLARFIGNTYFFHIINAYLRPVECEIGNNSDLSDDYLSNEQK